MSISDFDAFVRRQQKRDAREADFDPDQELTRWLDYLNALYDKISAYLKTYIESGAAQISYRTITLNEDFVGTYEAREMILKIGRAMVTFTPIGTRLIGTKGRVDVQGPAGTARLNLINKNVTSARQLIQVSFQRPGDPLPAPPSPEAIKQIELSWKISTPPPEMMFLELTQETFFDMVLTVANA